MPKCPNPHLVRSRLVGLAAAMCLPLVFAACGQKDPQELLASAKAYLAKNDRKAAVIQIKNAIQADPESGEARYLLGSTLLDEGDPVQAEVELRKAQRLGYAPDLVVPKLATDFLARGEAKKLIDEFGSAALQTPAAKAALATSLAAAHASLGDAPRTDVKLGDALAADPTYTPALLLRARLRMAEKDFKGASEIVDAVVRSAPQSAEAWKLKGEIEEVASDDHAGALESYRKAVAAKPDFLPARLAIVKLLMRDGKLDETQKEVEALVKIAPNDSQVRYVQTVLAYARKDMKAAQDLSAQLLKASPDSVQVLLLAASIELETNSAALAQTHLARALELAPESVAARRLLMAAFLRAGHPDQAIAALYSGHADKRVDPALYSVAGDAYLRNGDAKTAEDFFAKAAKLDPKDAGKRTSLAVARLSSGDAAAGLEDLREVAASDTGTSADIALISAYMAKAQTDKALKAIDALERKQPDQPVAAYLRGRVQLTLHNGASARTSFAQALALAPTYFPAAASLAAMDVAENKLPEAKGRLTDFLAKNPTHSKALMALAEVNAKAGASRDETAAAISKAINANPSDPDPRLMLIDFYARAGDIKQAIASAQSAVAALPSNVDVLEALGQAQQQSGELNQAIGSFSRAAEMQPSSAQLVFRLATAQIANKSPREAEQSLQKALSIQPDLAEAQHALAAVYVDSGKTAAALKIAKALQEKRPQDGSAYALEGDIDVYEKDAKAAAAAYRIGLKQAPSTELAIKLHRVLVTSDNTEADIFASEWRKLHSQDMAFVFYLGDAATLRKEYPKAQSYYQAVLKAQPDNAAALNNLAWISNELHQPDAVALAEKANQLMPRQPAFMDTLAAVLADGKRFDEAIQVQSKAMEIEPRNPGLRLGLAKIYIKAGNKEKARSHLDQLALLGSAYPSQPEVSQLLKSL